MTTKQKQSKRILSVTVRRMIDEYPDVSYLQQEGFADRKQQFEDGVFDFVGVRADAEITVLTYLAHEKPGHSGGQFFEGTTQTITSGGLYGIESDSEPGYFESIERDQLAELRQQLRALGFSTRAISKAFQNVQHKDS